MVLDTPEKACRRQFSLRQLFVIVTAICIVVAINVAVIRFASRSETATVAGDIASALLVVFDSIVFTGLMCGLVALASLLSPDDSAINPRAKFERPARIIVLAVMAGFFFLTFGILATLIFVRPLPHILSPLVSIVGCPFVFAQILLVMLVPAMIRSRWWSRCPACGKRRGHWVSTSYRLYDFHCAACGFTKNNVWKTRD